MTLVITRDPTAANDVVYPWPFSLGADPVELNCGNEEVAVLCPAWTVGDKLGPGRHTWRNPIPQQPAMAYFVSLAAAAVPFDVTTSFMIPTTFQPVRLRADGVVAVRCVDPSVLVAQFVGLPFDRLDEGLRSSVSHSVERLVARLLTRRVVLAGNPDAVCNPDALPELAAEIIAHGPTAGAVFGIDLVQLVSLRITTDDGGSEWPQRGRAKSLTQKGWAGAEGSDGKSSSASGEIRVAPAAPPTPAMTKTLPPTAPPPVPARKPAPPTLPNPIAAPDTPTPRLPGWDNGGATLPSIGGITLETVRALEAKRLAKLAGQGSSPSVVVADGASDHASAIPSSVQSGTIDRSDGVPKPVEGSGSIDVLLGDADSNAIVDLDDFKTSDFEMKHGRGGAIRMATGDDATTNVKESSSASGAIGRVGVGMGVGVGAESRLGTDSSTEISTPPTQDDILGARTQYDRFEPGTMVLVAGADGRLQSATVKHHQAGYYELEIGGSSETVWVPVTSVVPER